MPLPAFLIPALTGFALSKLTGQSTKSSLRNALIGGITGGITSGFGASQAGTAVTGANVSGAERVALGIGDPNAIGLLDQVLWIPSNQDLVKRHFH
jgi:hypothetical protein